MKILLDTHCWLWWLEGNSRLRRDVAERISDRNHEVYLSAASAWEISIKFGLGKLKLPAPPRLFVPDRLAKHGFSSLEIHTMHVLEVADLPPVHRDPFDRLLVAQARLERMRLVTSDPVFKKYDLDLIWAE
ncbi:MAG: type II toxin-antitoxin system VapC family toxin [Bdellovibrionales bacterium]|nr:type II toxin-antitoxin system VapC family toxin [Bdellovibrionales bacterium]